MPTRPCISAASTSADRIIDKTKGRAGEIKAGSLMRTGIIHSQPVVRKDLSITVDVSLQKSMLDEIDQFGIRRLGLLKDFGQIAVKA